jgi:hypothetical protein
MKVTLLCAGFSIHKRVSGLRAAGLRAAGLRAAGLIFFHMLLVVWWFGVRCLHMVPGRRSHLFSYVTGCVVVW